MGEHDADTPVPAAVLGEFLGISARAVADLGARGIAIKAGPGRWHLRASVARYCDDLRRDLAGRGGSPAATVAAHERGRLAKARADAQEARNALLSGTLVDVVAVEQSWKEVLRRVRSGVMAVPSRVAARLGHLKPSDVAVIDAEVRAVLTELGHDRDPR